MLKQVLVRAPGAEHAPIRLDLEEGVTQRDVLTVLKERHGIDAAVLRKGDGRKFAPGEEVYASVEPGETLLYNTSTEAGDGSTVVRPSFAPLHVARGWRAFKGGFVGHYAVGERTFGGEARRVHGEAYRFFLHEPPPELRRHPRWGCFSAVGNGWFSVNFAVQPRSLDSGISYLEQLLTEAVGGASRRAAS